MSTATPIPAAVLESVAAFQDACIDMEHIEDAATALQDAIAEAISAAADKARMDAEDRATERTKYNGWTNYETWRVNLEIWGDTAWDEHGTTYASVYELADHMKEDTDLLLSDEFGEQLRMDYARSFISDVNWYELAEHYAEDFPELIESDEEVNTCEECGEDFPASESLIVGRLILCPLCRGE